jgi:hypothetical protein
MKDRWSKSSHKLIILVLLYTISSGGTDKCTGHGLVAETCSTIPLEIIIHEHKVSGAVLLPAKLLNVLSEPRGS